MTATTRRVDAAERRARLGRRHHLAPSARAAGPVEVAGSLVGLHGTDPATVFLAAAARARDGTVAALERALYDDRVLVRMLGMRRTMFVVPVELAPVVQAACARAIAARERRRLFDLVRDAGLADDGEWWFGEVVESVLQTLAARGEATATELGKDEPRLREQVILAAGKPYEARQSISTRLLYVLAAEGRIVRGHPRGSWLSGQFRWTRTEDWLAGGPAADIDAVPTEPAQVELARRWLAGYGPAAVADLAWWTGWPAGQVKRVLAEIGPAEVDLDGVPGVVLADDLDPVDAVEPWVALLPALDPTVMGWTGREWYLGEHGPALFDRSGNPGPTIWSDGRIVGGWAQRKDGEIAVRFLEDVGSEVTAAVRAEAERLRDRLGDVRVTPRFRTALERELSA